MSDTTPDYGIDAPGLRRGFLLAGAGLLALCVAAISLRWTPWLAVPAGLAAAYALGMAALMTWGSRIGKVRGRDTILDLIDWRGDEAVLDVACGRGLIMIGAAKRLTSGMATGIDLWLDRDQSDNNAPAVERNAAIEGVADRIAIVTGDMRALPFADSAFDVVLSHWGVHNLPTPADRAVALAEMARVLRSGGTMIVTDIACRGEYMARLQQLGMADIRLIVTSDLLDLFYGAVSFGSYRPASIVCCTPMA